MRKKNRLLLAFIWIYCVVIGSTFAQYSTSNDSLFVTYLLEKKYYNDVLHWTQHRQTLPYHRGLAFYNQQQLDSAIHYFEQVPISHQSYVKAKFLQGFGYTYLQRYPLANRVLARLHTSDTLYLALQNFQRAGIALLHRDVPLFDSLQKSFAGKYFAFSQEEDKLTQHAQLIRTHRRKAPVVAALLSTIVPGSGKIYAGKTGQGVITLIQNLALGLQAYEAYRRDGWKSPRFLIYGGLFTFFYVGNIWGSSLSIHIRNQEFNDKVNQQILFNMQVPIRAVFNQ
ncbi:MAG: hypothetical protein R2822_06490 [Spirosomataceae bacterium]